MFRGKWRLAWRERQELLSCFLIGETYGQIWEGREKRHKQSPAGWVFGAGPKGHGGKEFIVFTLWVSMGTQDVCVDLYRPFSWSFFLAGCGIHRRWHRLERRKKTVTCLQKHDNHLVEVSKPEQLLTVEKNIRCLSWKTSADVRSLLLILVSDLCVFKTVALFHPLL